MILALAEAARAAAGSACYIPMGVAVRGAEHRFPPPGVCFGPGQSATVSEAESRWQCQRGARIYP